MHEPALICVKCEHAFGISGAGEVRCPNCQHLYELPFLQSETGTQALPDILKETIRTQAVLESQVQELKRSLESSKNRASDRRMKIAEQQKTINQLNLEIAHLQAPPPSDPEPTASAESDGLRRALAQLEKLAHARSQELEATKQELQQTATTLQRHDAEKQAANEMIGLLQQQLDEALEKLQQAAADDAPDDVLKLKQENEQARSQLIEVKLEMVSLRENMVQAQNDVPVLQKALAEKEAEATKLEQKLSSADSEQERLFDLYQETKNQFGRAQQHAAACENQATALQEQVNQLSEELQLLQTTHDELNATHTETSARLQALEKEAAERQKGGPFGLLRKRS